MAWQPWGSRLHLPFFVLISAFTATVISRWCHKPLIWYCLIFILTISSFPPLVFSAPRPLLQNNYVQTSSPPVWELTRGEMRFNKRPELKTPYSEAIKLINDRKCYDIGLYFGGDSWEYPLWAIAKQDMAPAKVRFRSINVGPPSENISSNPNQTFIPCAVLVVDRPEVENPMEVPNVTKNRTIQYSQVKNLQEVRVFVPSSPKGE